MKGATILPLVVTEESNKGETSTPQSGQGKGEGSNKCVKNLHYGNKKNTLEKLLYFRVYH